MLRIVASLATVLLLVEFGTLAQAADWKPAAGPLMTRWAKDVNPAETHAEYPRPQMSRAAWQSLNGLWEYAIEPSEAPRPAAFRGQILVPFPVESALSGVMTRVKPGERLWYRRTFEVPPAWLKQRVVLNFGAVDWETVVTVNGKEVGKHRGGYDPFSFDVTAALNPAGPQELVVAVTDPTSDSFQPRGKQIQNPHGIWYTPTTGIWQSVWLEPVPRLAISSLQITPDIDAGEVGVKVQAPGVAARGARFTVSVLDGEREVAMAEAREHDEVVLKIPEAKLWSPDTPFLYTLKISYVGAAGAEPDRVGSYFGMRKTSLGKDERGITRMLLNNKPLFQYGFLDQGFWPDGLYTAPTDEALRYDIEITKKLGFNMARKHVKVEPQRWYYWCDKLGLLVWQDMPSGDAHVAPNKGEIQRSAASSENFDRELKSLIDTHRNHPSIVMWVPFNEGWGQADTVRVTKWVKEYDPSRLVNCASGWNDFPVGDVHDIHVYPGPASPEPEEHRAAVLGEFGGLGLPVRGHTWQSEKNWGYRSFETKEALTEAYLDLITRLRPLIHTPGLSAAIYTQTTDVEIEVNGFLTYDREVLKLPLEQVAAAHRKLYLPPPKLTTVIATSQKEPHEWRYTTEAPAEDWFKADFDDSEWKTGQAGFGQANTPGSVVRTEWKSPDIWLRREIELPAGELHDPHLVLHHDEDAEVYLNGALAAKVTGYTTDYQTVGIRQAARAQLKPGKIVIAVHCKQTGGGQYIDVGINDLEEQPAKKAGE